jgi:hypothetical protein
LPAALIATMAKSTWVAAGQPCCLIGDSGTGKSHLLIGLGTAAAENGYRVTNTPPPECDHLNWRPVWLSVVADFGWISAPPGW